MKQRWTKKECEFLSDNYKKIGPDGCSQEIHRSVNSIKKKAVRIGLCDSHHSFTDHEVEYMKKHYMNDGPIKISSDLKLDISSICQKAHKLGIKMSKESRGKISTRTNTGRKQSESTKEKIGNGNRKYDESKACVDCGIEIVRMSTRCKSCGAKERGGEGHMWWKGGISSFRNVVQSRLYKAWKFPVMERDGFKCADCGNSGYLEVHHLRMYYKIRDSILASNPHLSFNDYEDKIKLAELIVSDHKLEDGITLCRSCHEQRHWEKQDELLGTPNDTKDEGNQQPSASNVISIVDVKVQRLTGEESLPIIPTRASCTIPLSMVMI